MAPVIRALRAQPDLSCSVCVTGQHREMLDQVLSLFDIQSDVDLSVMRAGQDLYDVTSRVLVGMRDALRTLRPDVLLVHGDTTTCFAAALAGFYSGVPVAHVEAGLRTGSLQAPFPEEANRSLVARLARLHFAPTESARQNLLRENIPDNRVHVTGNTVIDALLWTRDSLGEYSMEFWTRHFSASLLAQLSDPSGRVVLVTGHRGENFGHGLVELCDAIRDLAVSNPTVAFVYPVHLNPNVQRPVRELLGTISNVHLIEPLGYLPFVFLMHRSYIILTDSGGIQEEAPSLGKPVLVLRDVTERPEALHVGAVRLVGANRRRIVEAAQDLLDHRDSYENMSRVINPYGDGHAATRIANILSQELELARQA